MATPALEAPPPSVGRDAPTWMWAPSVPPQTQAPSANAPTGSAAPYWEMNLPTGQSPHRYMMYRPDASEQGVMPAANLVAPPAAMYPFPMAVHPDPSRMTTPATVGGYAMMPLPGAFPMLDGSSFPMLMQVPPVPPYTMPDNDRAPDTDGRFPDAWAPLATAESEAASSRVPNMEDLLALSRQAQMEADGGPNANVFVCPHCEKRYVGKHARSIWRRHLQDKHAIPLSVQPRRTRWDRDANRPRNAAERRERMLESKRRWARKKREQERRLAAAERASASVTVDVPEADSAAASTTQRDEADDERRAPASTRTVSPEPAPLVDAVRSRAPSAAVRPPSACAGTGVTVPGSTMLHPTPRRAALAPRDMNVMRRNDMAKSPNMLDAKLFMPSPMQSTPLRQAFAHMTTFPMPSPTETRIVPDSARRPPPGMPPLSAKRASASKGRTDQFSSPQHLNLTQSLGLAPHSAAKGTSHYGGMYSTHGTMTPMGASGTPLSRLPLGLTPTLGGLLRGDVSGSGFLHAGDLSGCMMGLPSLDSPRRSSVRRHGLRSNASFHSSSERDDDDDPDDDGEMRIVSPSLRQRVRGASKALQPTPTKVGSPLRHATNAPRPRTPRSATRLR